MLVFARSMLHMLHSLTDILLLSDSLFFSMITVDKIIEISLKQVECVSKVLRI